MRLRLCSRSAWWGSRVPSSISESVGDVLDRPNLAAACQTMGVGGGTACSGNLRSQATAAGVGTVRNGLRASMGRMLRRLSRHTGVSPPPTWPTGEWSDVRQGFRTATPATNRGKRWDSAALGECESRFLNVAIRSVNRKVQGSNPCSGAKSELETEAALEASVGDYNNATTTLQQPL
jgi:hypothetical protein